MQTKDEQPKFFRRRLTAPLLMMVFALLLAGCVALTESGTIPGATLPQPDAPATAAAPVAAQIQRDQLAMQLQLDPAAVQITEAEAVTWPDSCLGISNPAELCAAAETAGYRVVLTANGAAYRYHTNADGSYARLAAAPAPQIGEPLVEWSGNGMMGCTTAQIAPDGVAIGRCYEEVRLGVPFHDERHAAELADFVATFASFEADTPAGALTFMGKGDKEATAAEERMIAEWARLVQLAAAGSPQDEPLAVALTWHREGGFAGFCDDLTISVSGAAWASSCRYQDAPPAAPLWLDAESLATLYEWVDTFQPFDYQQSDGAVADSMAITLTFSGVGDQVATDTEQAAIVDFAQLIYDRLSAETMPVDAPATDAGEALVEAVTVRQ